MSTQAQKPTAEQEEILRLISEQRAIPLDQLARFLDMYMSDAWRVVEELEALRFVCVEEIQADQQPWIWLTKRSVRLSGAGYYRAARPSVSWLAHIRAVNEARIQITKRSPEGRWICERELRRRWTSPGSSIGNRALFRRHVPDAIFELSGKTHAIEVELSLKPESRLRPILADHSIRYDVVAYFCTPRVARKLNCWKLTSDYSNLIVRELMVVDTSLVPEPCMKLASKVEPKPEMLPVIDLISEQGAIPLDQLARFLNVDLGGAEQVVSDLAKEGSIRRSRPLANEPDWIWLSARGAHFSTTGLNCLRPKLGGLRFRRALNEVRLCMNDYAPKGKWVSARILRKQIGEKGLLPSAIVEVGSERHAIEICLSQGSKPAREERLTRRCAEYGFVSVFCAPEVYGRMKQMEATGRWPNLAVRCLSADLAHQRSTSDHGSFEAVGRDEIIRVLRSAVAANQLLPSRARSLAGYLVLSTAGIDQGGQRTVYMLSAESRGLGLLRRPQKDLAEQDRVEHSSGRFAHVEALIEALGRESTGRLAPSRARSIAGYLLLGDAGVPQGSSRAIAEYKRDCRRLGLSHDRPRLCLSDGSFEAVGRDEIIRVLRSAVAANQLLPSRARSLAGYLVLSTAGIDRGSQRTVYMLRIESRDLGLLRHPQKDLAERDRVEHSSGRFAHVEALIEALGREPAGWLTPRRARSIAGYLLLAAAGVPQGSSGAIGSYERYCRRLGLSLSPE